MGGDRANYLGNCNTPTSTILTVKLLLNSIISMQGEICMTIDIKDFYLNMPMPRYEYIQLKLKDLLKDFIEEYKLRVHRPNRQISVHLQPREQVSNSPPQI